METNETSAEDFWSHIEVNPLLLSLATPFRGMETAERCAIGYDTFCFTGQKIFCEVPGESNFTSFQAVRARELIDSMLVSYLPVTCITSQGERSPRHTIFAGHRPVVRKILTLVYTGFKVNGLVTLVTIWRTMKPSSIICTKLWPERLWWMNHGFLAEEDEGEESDDREAGEDNREEGEGDEEEGLDEPDIEEEVDKEDSDGDSDSECMPDDTDDNSDGGDM
jgi:hypothetical protein